MAFQHPLQRLGGVDEQREQVAQHRGLGKTRGLDVHVRLGQTGRDQVFGVLPVQEGEVTAVTDPLGVPPQHPQAHRVKGPAPQTAQVAAQQLAHPPHHLARGLVGEGQQQQALGGDPLLQQPRHPVHQRAGLARARPGQDQRRPRRRGHRLQLLGVEFRRVVNLVVDRRAERLHHVLARHTLIQTGPGRLTRQKPAADHRSGVSPARPSLAPRPAQGCCDGVPAARPPPPPCGGSTSRSVRLNKRSKAACWSGRRKARRRGPLCRSTSNRSRERGGSTAS